MRLMRINDFLLAGCVRLFISGIYRIIEADKIHIGDIWIFCCRLEYGIHGNCGRLFDGVAVHATADRRKGNTVNIIFISQLHAALVTAFEQVGLFFVAAVPHRPDRVDHVFRRQPVAAGNPGVAGGAAIQCSAFGQQFGTGCAVNGAIDTAAAEQRIVGGIDDRVYLQCGDVVGNNVNNCQIVCGVQVIIKVNMITSPPVFTWLRM